MPWSVGLGPALALVGCGRAIDVPFVVPPQGGATATVAAPLPVAARPVLRVDLRWGADALLAGDPVRGEIVGRRLVRGLRGEPPEALRDRSLARFRFVPAAPRTPGETTVWLDLGWNHAGKLPDEMSAPISGLDLRLVRPASGKALPAVSRLSLHARSPATLARCLVASGRGDAATPWAMRAMAAAMLGALPLTLLRSRRGGTAKPWCARYGQACLALLGVAWIAGGLGTRVTLVREAREEVTSSWGEPAETHWRQQMARLDAELPSLADAIRAVSGPRDRIVVLGGADPFIPFLMRYHLMPRAVLPRGQGDLVAFVRQDDVPSLRIDLARGSDPSRAWGALPRESLGRRLVALGFEVADDGRDVPVDLRLYDGAGAEILGTPLAPARRFRVDPSVVLPIGATLEARTSAPGVPPGAVRAWIAPEGTTPLDGPTASVPRLFVRVPPP